jgi:nucleotide-binding universal stress UspA family protein
MNTSHRVLVPFELPDPEPASPVMVEMLETIEVVVLGHYGLPDQTPPAAARDQFETDARAELEGLVQPFESTDVSVTTRLVFGKAREKTVDRIALEEHCGVILTPGQVDEIRRLFVPLRGKEQFDRILSFVGELTTATDASVILFHEGEESDRLPGREILEDAADRLAEIGVDPDRLDQRLSEDGEVKQSIVDLADTFDLLVLGETEPSLRERILGTVPAQVTADTDTPAFVVRNVEQTEQ